MYYTTLCGNKHFLFPWFLTGVPCWHLVPVTVLVTLLGSLTKYQTEATQKEGGEGLPWFLL